MKHMALYGIFLAGAVSLSAWLGMADAETAREGMPGTQLNTSKRHGLREGEVLVWDPNAQGAAPPDIAPPPQSGPPRRQSPPSRGQRQSSAASAASAYYRATRGLLPLAKPLGAPRRGEWRGQVNEPEQDYVQFIHEARSRRGTLIVLPIGDLPPDQKKAIGHLLDAMSAYFGMPAACAPPIPLASLPGDCFRNVGGRRQLNAETFMRRVLRPNVGGEVAAILAITALDLYPGDNWPFASAFGWSSFSEGTAVVSTHQVVNGNQAYRGRNLLRLCKLGVHELSHTFGLKHCTTYDCLMNGCSTLRENDAKPFVLCPDCLAKLSLATGRDPALHVEDMLGMCQAKGFSQDARLHARALERF